MTADFVWVEIQLLTHDGSDWYNCRVARTAYEQIAVGIYEPPFLRVFDIHWYKDHDDDNDAWRGKEIVVFGTGKKSEYDREAILRVDRIIAMFLLRHGPEATHD